MPFDGASAEGDVRLQLRAVLLRVVQGGRLGRAQGRVLLHRQEEEEPLLRHIQIRAQVGQNFCIKSAKQDYSAYGKTSTGSS